MIIFLDIDGVLNGHTRFPNGYCGTRWECVEQFNRILAETGADVVVSSAWRYLVLSGSMTLKGLENLLLSHGVDCLGKVVGVTSSDEDIPDRGLQVRHWMNEHGDGRRCVVLDDGGERDGKWSDLGLRTCGHPVVWTLSKVGLTRHLADEVIWLLRGGLEGPIDALDEMVAQAQELKMGYES